MFLPKDLFYLIFGSVFFISSILSQCESKANASEKEDEALTLAKSCLGETTWFGTADECLSILHIYKKRADKTNRTVLQVAKKYSSAIKIRKDHPNKWIFGINRDLTKPVGFPVSWTARHKAQVQKMIDVADAFISGYTDDPTPCATDYGSKFDKPHPALKLIKVDKWYRNRFYTIKGVHCER